MEETVEVCPSRLEHGQWCHRANKMIGEGDIAASYSADRIGMGSSVRKPFSFEGVKWVCVGAGTKDAKAYRLVHLAGFDGPTLTYGKRVCDGESARCDQSGFYHGMIVRHGGADFVLCGPEKRFVKGQKEQLDLFEL